MLSSVLDVQAFPWAADWYRTQARAALGDETDDRYRLWYVDNADHQPPSTDEGYAHIVLYDPVVQQALLDLDAWVRDGVEPAPTSSYEVTDDNQVELAASAEDRGGIQPVVSLSVSAVDSCESDAAADRADVDAGEPVAFHLEGEAPAGRGDVVRVEWDFESTGEFPESNELDEIEPNVDLCEVHTYEEPGTYFAVARVTTQREGDPDSPYRLVQNLARVRVVVG